MSTTWGVTAGAMPLLEEEVIPDISLPDISGIPLPEGPEGMGRSHLAVGGMERSTQNTEKTTQQRC